jgi:lysophospholipase L1-like esterase
MCAILQQRLTFVRNAGVPGNNSTQMRDRLQSDVLDYRPDVVSILAGANDAGQSVDINVFKANIINIVERLLAAGVQPWLVLTLNRGNQTYLPQHLKQNDWQRWYAEQMRIPCLDFFKLMCDPATGQLQAAYDFGDGVHPSQAGHRVMAQYAADTMAPTLQPFAPYRPLTNALDAENLIPNPLMLTGSAPPTGYVPNGTTMTGYTEQQVTDTDFLGGKAWEINFTNPSNAAGFRAFNSTCSGAAPAAGDLMRFTAQTKMVSVSNVTVAQNVGLRFNAVFVGATDPAAQILQLTYGDATVHGLELYSWQARVPAGTTQVQFQPMVNLIPTNGQMTARLGEFGAWNLTRMGQE